MPELIDRLSLIDKLDKGQKKALDAKDFTSFYALVYFKAMLQNEPEIHAMNPKTNGDRLRSMSDEQIAEFLCFSNCTIAEKECPQWDNKHCDGDCPKHFYEWLKQDVNENHIAGTSKKVGGNEDAEH
jgi:hypothetical protein